MIFFLLKEGDGQKAKKDCPEISEKDLIKNSVYGDPVKDLCVVSHMSILTFNFSPMKQFHSYIQDGVVQVHVCSMSDNLGKDLAKAGGKSKPSQLGGKLNKLGKDEGLKPGVFVGLCIFCP